MGLELWTTAGTNLSIRVTTPKGLLIVIRPHNPQEQCVINNGFFIPVTLLYVCGSDHKVHSEVRSICSMYAQYSPMFQPPMTVKYKFRVDSSL